MSRSLPSIGRRAILLGGAATAGFTVTGCSITGPTARHNGLYHFTMPANSTLDQLLQGLSAILGRTTLDHIVDVAGDGLSAGDIVTVKAPSQSVLVTERLEDQVQTQLALADFVADLEVVEKARWFGICQRDGESPIGGNQFNCRPPPGTVKDLAWPLRKMNVPQAWALSRLMKRPAYGEGILIGHVDTGVTTHIELHGASLTDEGYDFIDNRKGAWDPGINNVQYLEQIGHGTATSSVIVSRGGVGPLPKGDLCDGTMPPGRITGTAPAALLLPVRAFRLASTRNLPRIAKAIDFLRRKRVHVITMALGWAWGSRILEEAISRAIDENIVVMSAAGNFVGKVVSPANDGRVIAVGGIGPHNEAWCGSSYGRTVTVSAPADKVWRAYVDPDSRRDDLVGPRSGTSFSVSMTAGVAALWLAHHGRDALIADMAAKGHTNLQAFFRSEVTRTAYAPEGWAKHNGALGAGIVDAEALLRGSRKAA